MKLYFVRHGETEWNVKKKIQGKTDIPLNENGIRQAKELACQLVEEDISVKHVYHSPQLRAAETARIAAEALHATCIPLDGLVALCRPRRHKPEDTHRQSRWVEPNMA